MRNLRDCQVSSKPLTVFRASPRSWGRPRSSNRHGPPCHIDEDSQTSGSPDDSALVTHLATHDENHATAVTQRPANAHRTGKDSSLGISSREARCSGLSAAVAHLATSPPHQDHSLEAPQIHPRLPIVLCEKLFLGRLKTHVYFRYGSQDRPKYR